MQYVGRRVIGLYLLAPDAVYGGSHSVAGLERAALDPGPENLVVAGWDGVEHLELAAVGGDPPDVRHLPAAGGVERVLFEHDVELPFGLPRELDGYYPGLDLLALVANEAALYLPVPEGSDRALVALHGLPRPLSLCRHRGLEARLVERDPPLGQHLPRHLNREP